MAYYNHFAFEKYMAIGFSDLSIGDKFRMDKFKGKIRRKDIIMIKTGELSYQEQKSGKQYTLLNNNFYVSSFDKLKNQ